MPVEDLSQSGHVSALVVSQVDQQPPRVHPVDLQLREARGTVQRAESREQGGPRGLASLPRPARPVSRTRAERQQLGLRLPRPDRQMLDEQTKLEEVLRRAMARAGLVTHYEHVCRRCKHEGRPHMEKQDDAELRRCSALCRATCAKRSTAAARGRRRTPARESRTQRIKVRLVRRWSGTDRSQKRRPDPPRKTSAKSGLLIGCGGRI